MQNIKAVRRVVTRRPWVSGGVAAVVVLGAAGGTWWATSGGSKAATTAPTYRLVAASVQTIKQSVSASGTIEPADQDSLTFPASGRVTSVLVATGDTVKKDQVLGTIDSAALAASLASAQATLAQDQARVAADQTNGASTSQAAADAAAVTAAQSQVTTAQAQLTGATLRSPIDGVVATVNVAAGDQVGGSSGSSGGSNSGSNSSSGSNGSNSGANSGSTGGSNSGSNSGSSSSAAFVVIGTSSWMVTTSVDDTQVGLVKKGNQAQITTDGGTTVFGTISSVGVIASSSSGTASYPVTVKITGSPTGLHAGATGTVSLIYKQLTDVLTVPTLAVHTSNGEQYVEELSNNARVKHTVTTGLASGGLTQIVSGLSEGDQVVVDIPQLPGGTSSTNRTGRTGTGGGFGGGGFGGGGFTGGGFGGGGNVTGTLRNATNGNATNGNATYGNATNGNATNGANTNGGSK